MHPALLTMALAALVTPRAPPALAVSPAIGRVLEAQDQAAQMAIAGESPIALAMRIVLKAQGTRIKLFVGARWPLHHTSNQCWNLW